MLYSLGLSLVLTGGDESQFNELLKLPCEGDSYDARDSDGSFMAWNCAGLSGGGGTITSIYLYPHQFTHHLEVMTNRVLALSAFQFVALASLLDLAHAQQSTIVFEINTGEGLVYFLLIFFFIFYFCTPVFRYIYVNYLTDLMERAQQQAVKAQKRLTEKLSDAGRKVSQSIRTV